MGERVLMESHSGVSAAGLGGMGPGTFIPQQRVRHSPGAHVDKRSAKNDFINPFDYESSIDARVQLELEHLYIPFSYRYFDGDAPTIHKLIPAYEPEFTLKEYKVVIITIGNFYGSLPGSLDQAALAKVLLEQDGWRQIAWYESEIRGVGVASLIQRDLPELEYGWVQGPERPSPVGHPLTLETRRRWLRGLALLRKLYGPKTVEAANGSSERRRHKFIRNRTGDSGRVRPGGKGHEQPGN